MMMVPGASRPSNETVSRGIGVAIGCNCESSALAKTGAVPALRKRPAQTAARIRLRRMIPPWRQSTASTDVRRAADAGPDSSRSHDYCAKKSIRNPLRRKVERKSVNCVKL